MLRLRVTGAVLRGVLVCGGVFATSAAAAGPAIQVSQAWSRPTAPGAPTGVIYLTLANPGGAPDRLTGGSTPVAARMELHRSSMTGGIMSMDAVPGGLEIMAHGHAALAPSGYHFMLVGLKSGLNAGAHFGATLNFAHSPPAKIEVTVRAVAPEPSMTGMRMR